MFGNQCWVSLLARLIEYLICTYLSRDLLKCKQYSQFSGGKPIFLNEGVTKMIMSYRINLYVITYTMS